MTDRLIVAYALMLLLALGVGGVIWWNLYHSHRRTYARRLAAERRKELAAAMEREDGSARS